MERVVGGSVIRTSLRSISTFLLVATLAASVYGQGYPLPSKTPNTPVLCDPAVWPGCIESAAGKLTPGWDLPIANYVGRMLDSTLTRDYQQAFRTARTFQMRVAPTRFYLNTGGAVLAYNIDSFFSRMNANVALVPSTSIPVTGTWRLRPPPPEVLLRWDQFFNAGGSSWTTPVTDGFQRLMDLDFDDRGYLYLAYSEFKWGVVKDDFNLGANWMTSLYQSYPYSGTPGVIIAVKTSDGKYNAVIPTGATSQVWFMGDANGLQHVRKPDISVGIARWAKSSDGTRLALVGRDGVIRIFKNDDLVNNAAPIGIFPANTGRYTDVTTDGTNFFAVWSSAGSSSGMTVFTRNGESFLPTTYTFPWYYLTSGQLAVPFISFGGNVIAINGYEPPSGTWNVRLFQLSNLVPSELKDRNNNSTRYFAQYYSGADTFLRPTNSSIYFSQPYKQNGKIYLIVGSYSLADVYEIAAGNALSAHMKSPAVGPYYGDKVTFTTAAPSNPTVNWTFGDGGTAIVSPTTPGYPDVDHQYTGRTEASLPASLNVVATNAADSTAFDSFTLNLKAPQIGFAVKNHPELLFRLPDASSPAPIVSGDQFVDVGDGMTGGHYVDWSSSAVGAAQTGAGGSIGVGTCGAYQLIYNAHYGPFDPGVTPFSIPAASDAKYSINSFNYAVRPFAMAVTRTVSDTTMTFTATSRLGGVADLPGAGATACTFLYELLNASNAVVDTMGDSAHTLASIPPYIATKSKLVDGPMHLRLTVTVNPSALSGSCSGFNTQISKIDFDGTLVPPPGACGSIKDDSVYIGFYGSTTGCTPAHNTCSASDLLSFSVYAQNGWAFSCEPFTYAWNFGDGQTAAERQPTHGYSSNGTFNVSVAVTDGSGKSATFRASVAVNGGNSQPPPNPNPGGCASLTSQSAYLGF